MTRKNSALRALNQRENGPHPTDAPIFYPRTIILESGSLESLNLKIFEAENHGYYLKGINSHFDSFFASHSAIMARRKPNNTPTWGRSS